jgi:hypothetical protein
LSPHNGLPTATGINVVLVQEPRGGTLPPKPAERDWPRMDPPNVLWFFGAFTITFAVYALIETLPDDQNGLWVFLTAIGLLVGFAVTAWLLLRRWWWVPGGLAASLAVATFPAVAVGFLKLIDVWPDDPFFQPFDEFSGYTFGVGLATAVVGYVAYWLTRFTFALGVGIAAILVSAQLLTPCFGESPSGDDRATMALVIGAVLVVISVFIDAVGRRRDAFWFQALGWFSVAAGLVYFTLDFDGDVDRGWLPMLIGGALMLIIAGPIRRATWAVFGVVGAYAAVVHYLTLALNEDRWPFALALLALALAIFCVGMVLHRYGQVWAPRVVRRAPPTFGR